MKKSTLYHTAMVSVLEDERLDTEMRLEIIKLLSTNEETAKFTEKQEEERGV